MTDNKNNKSGEAQRTGEEADIQKELKQTDKNIGQAIKDKPYSNNRNEKRRGQFIDFWGDEDGNPVTSEKTFRSKKGDPLGSVDSTPSTSSTTSTGKTTSTTDK